MSMWISRSGSKPSDTGETVTPWERANFTGFSIHPLTVFTMASMSKAVITTQGDKKDKTCLTCLDNEKYNNALKTLSLLIVLSPFYGC